VGVSIAFVFYGLFSTQILSMDFDYLKKPASSAIDEIALFSTCTLAEFDSDGWTKEIIEKSRIDIDPIRNCDQNFTTFTVLGENGTVWLNPKKELVDEVICLARSIYLKAETYINASEWFPVHDSASNVTFNSDFVHTRCTKVENATDIREDFVHLQMWIAKDDGGGKLKANNTWPFSGATKSPTTTKLEDGGIDEKPSVFIFVLDSVANSQALRSLPKTASILKHEFGAVNLRHVNKAGENSHPNGIALFIGKLITDLDRGLFGMGKERADWNQTYACDRFFDDEPFILKEFTKNGYKSLMAEDWMYGVFNFPGCWGFKNAPVTHYMRPFQIYYESNMKQSRAFMGEPQCLEFHTHLLNYLEKFMTAYKKSPKISLVWASELAHNDNDGLFHIDGQLFNYFRKHKDKMDKSYVFLMGDHGIRWGRIRDTWEGQREINNPMMFVSVPKHLRELVNPVLRINSNELLTSFDIHASLVDILNDPHLRSQDGPGGLRGVSVFRPLPPGERSCRTLPIPTQFCLCEWNKTMSEDKAMNDAIGKGAVHHLNGQLRAYEMADSCEEYTFNRTTEVKTIDGTDGLTEIVFAANECDAQFKTIVRARRTFSGEMNVTLAASDFTRWNGYGDTAACMDARASLRPLCCCRNRSRSTTTTVTTGHPPTEMKTTMTTSSSATMTASSSTTMTASSSTTITSSSSTTMTSSRSTTMTTSPSTTTPMTTIRASTEMKSTMTASVNGTSSRTRIP
ncbi:hypothetical protein PENTCL1PPCAC_15939, partial [Pristionchus entomophagus]